MFNVGPLELVVLGVVGLIILGPDRLPGLARDAARMLRTLRDLAQGARTQLRDELGPEFAELDLRNLNPRTAIQRAVLGDDVDLRNLNPRTYLQDTILGADEKAYEADAADAVNYDYGGGNDGDAGQVSLTKPAGGSRTQPLGRGEAAPFDPDAT
jgi:sec-independent protein translocase protein TatB